VAEHRQELLLQFGRCAGIEQARLGGRNPPRRIEMRADQIGEQAEHAHDAGHLEPGGLRIERTQRSEETAVGKKDRHRNVGLETVHRRRVMMGVALILRNVIDDHGLARLVHLVADRGLDLQFVAGRKAEPDLVVGGKADPAIAGHARDGRETKARDFGDDGQNRRNGGDRRDGVDISLEVVLHQSVRRLYCNSEHYSRSHP